MTLKSLLFWNWKRKLTVNMTRLTESHSSFTFMNPVKTAWMWVVKCLICWNTRFHVALKLPACAGLSGTGFMGVIFLSWKATTCCLGAEGCQSPKGAQTVLCNVLPYCFTCCYYIHTSVYSLRSFLWKKSHYGWTATVTCFTSSAQHQVLNLIGQRQAFLWFDN